MQHQCDEWAQPETGAATTVKQPWVKPVLTEAAVNDVTEAAAGIGPDGVQSFYNS